MEAMQAVQSTRSATPPPPVKQAPLEEPAPAIRRRLEAAVLEVFSNSDFHQANIRTVAKKAGVSFGTIYKYYGSKEGLLFSFVDDWLAVLTERMVDHLQGMQDLKEKLRKVFWLQLDYYERHPGVGRILFMTVPTSTWMSDETFKQKKMIGVFLNVLKEGQQSGVLDDSVPAGTLLDVMHGMVQRSFFMWNYRGQSESLAGRANELFEIVWRGICRPRDC